MSANLENSAVARGLEKVSFHSYHKEEQCQRMLKLSTIVLISHTSTVMIKILQARLQLYMNRGLPDIQGGFREGREIRDTKGTFHTNMGSIKDRNGMDLTEAKDIKKKWQEYTEELYKKISS